MSSSLFDAAAAGDIGSMNKFLDVDDLDIDATNPKGQTALHCAAITGEAAAGGLLVECDADVNVVDPQGNTPLMLAAANNHRLVASMLLWGGCHRDVKNADGQTALHFAAQKGAKDVVYLITENGGEHTALMKNNAGLTPLDLAVAHGACSESIEMIENAIKEQLQAKANAAAKEKALESSAMDQAD